MIIYFISLDLLVRRKPAPARPKRKARARTGALLTALAPIPDPVPDLAPRHDPNLPTAAAAPRFEGWRKPEPIAPLSGVVVVTLDNDDEDPQPPIKMEVDSPPFHPVPKRRAMTKKVASELLRSNPRHPLGSSSDFNFHSLILVEEVNDLDHDDDDDDEEDEKALRSIKERLQEARKKNPPAAAQKSKKKLLVRLPAQKRQRGGDDDDDEVYLLPSFLIFN
ncbi:MAG TPA: hypothetical protein VHN59_09945 [Chitinophagaceae bacterium]|nr:hypothetical protein [Chitinophagaceae bacterium]